ncbi:hypothetical protein [Chromobacterium sp. Beijing]|uniref:hypothetical protein n=1 Tax=Chromobacterium sp. Beijing TaxID=2735795 RepID=UPI001F423FD0|nr:hypothetical protein [Chromobacterium sp. Beijing]
MANTESDSLIIRRASAADAPAVLSIFDEIIAWFAEIQNPGQWGRSLGPASRDK